MEKETERRRKDGRQEISYKGGIQGERRKKKTNENESGKRTKQKNERK